MTGSNNACTNAVSPVCAEDHDGLRGDTAVIDYGRSACLYHEGGYHYAALATSVAFGEHLVLVYGQSINDPTVRYDPLCRDVAHEQLGPLPPTVEAKIATAARPRCGRPTRHGRPCRVTVPAPGDSCPWHGRRRHD
ncbi:hypothetical protein [Mycobacterium paragordonae]|uniref:Uncharacterized protein n=1 Tax=Mycobacterium paragordonae TaxID=1389713 RepID=A0A4R5WIW4_9MYCO|nr:hypothetical protein [Mycobacterium paragordonae]MDP7738986.1 hypothetical protein [Mycobacterium paragordonae]TDK90278.1 hypothetical protein EUA02_23875 [Mycobacterium paragordonae]TDL03095.1 hypothetical protein EUA05_25630 [Mycobacterium paragordonae]